MDRAALTSGFPRRRGDRPMNTLEDGQYAGSPAGAGIDPKSYHNKEWADRVPPQARG